jgi:hypothetical protein
MHSIRPAFLVLAISLIFSLPGALLAQAKKVALVIGNSNYSTASLRNPVNDAADMAEALREIGFTVALGTDASKKTMYQLVDQFGQDIRGASIALFYYSGHGVQVNGENYLIPVGADISLASDVETEGVQLQRVMGRMNAGGAGTNVVILDACRNNPFPQASKDMERGLAVVGTKPPESVIVYATEAGETAADGVGRNGVFTAALLRNIKRSEEITAVIRDVNAEVRHETNQKQKPAKYDNLTRAVYLAGNQASAASASPVPTAQAPIVSIAAPSMPKLTVTRSYGSLVVSIATTGSLYLDGQAMGDISVGEEAKVDPVEVGDRSLELHYPDGQVETKTVRVEADAMAKATFTYKPEPREPNQASAQSGEGQTYIDRTYHVGDTGPAGGIIFFDKGSKSAGWRYLEAGTKDLGYCKGLGSWNLCKNYTGGNFHDWVLPSADELKLMYQNLYKNRLGNFISDCCYWSSSCDVLKYGEAMDFYTGQLISGQETNNDIFLVRPLRRF